jgi:hypothetical protein
MVMSGFNRALLILLAIQVLVIMLVDVPTFTTDDGRPSSRDRIFYPEFDADRAVRITLSQGDETLYVSRPSVEDRRWTVQAAGGGARPADPFRVDSLLSSIALMKRGEVHSRNPGKAAAFGLDEAFAVRLEIFDEEGTRRVDLLVGKHLGPVRGTYVQRIGEKEVYLVSENLRRYCTDGKGDWIAFWQDKTVFAFSSAEISGIVLKNGEGDVVAEYGPEDEKMEAMQSALAQLRSREDTLTRAAPDALGLEEPEWILEISVESASGPVVHRLRMAKERDGYRHVMLDDETSTLQKIPEYALSPLLRDAVQVLEKEGDD